MTFKEDFPELNKIECFIKPVDQQLFSYRHGHKKVLPEDVFNIFLERDCLSKTRVKEAIEKWSDYSSDRLMVKNSLLKELGLE